MATEQNVMYVFELKCNLCDKLFASNDLGNLLHEVRRHETERDHVKRFNALLKEL